MAICGNFIAWSPYKCDAIVSMFGLRLRLSAFFPVGNS